MLILNPYQNKVLMPVRQQEWRSPSLSQPKDQFGNENRTRFRLRARLDDGAVKWVGWFDSRDDADAFLWGMALHANGAAFPVENFRLFNEVWGDPSFEPWLTYDFATVTFLTSPTGSNQTYTSPSDWNNSNNTIELLASGGTGASSSNVLQHKTGGGGGEYGATTNFSFATPGTTTATYRIAALASGVTAANGNDGTDSWWNGTTQAGATLGALRGIGGVTGTGSRNGGAGGTGGVGTTHKAGGRGGNLTGASSHGASGGGGAAGPTNAGSNGGDSSSISVGVVTDGGSGDGGLGGAGSVGNSGGASSNGSAGTEWDASHGSGGASGGSSNAGTGTGGNYGAGSGAVDAAASASGNSSQGIIVVTYAVAGTAARLIPQSMGPLVGWA